MNQFNECAAEKVRQCEVASEIKSDIDVTSTVRKVTLTELAHKLDLTFWQHAPSGGNDFIVVSAVACLDHGGSQ